MSDMKASNTRYFGKYRGTVASNVDPDKRGRLQIGCSAVLGTNTLSWALPCVPYAGRDEGLFLIPPVGANIWVEFEGGSLDSPIWSGCFWGSGEAPELLPTRKVLKTPGATITIDDVNPAEALVIETTTGHRIEVNVSGITIASTAGGKVEIAGPRVSINGGALEVI